MASAKSTWRAELCQIILGSQFSPIYMFHDGSAVHAAPTVCLTPNYPKSRDRRRSRTISKSRRNSGQAISVVSSSTASIAQDKTQRTNVAIRMTLRSTSSFHFHKHFLLFLFNRAWWLAVLV